MKRIRESINLQLFASIEEIIEGNKDSFSDGDYAGQFTNLSTKLGELGFDILINNKKQAEFVPSSRLGEVASQRDAFKNQVNTLNAQLMELQKNSGDNQKLQKDLQDYIDKNLELLGELEKTRINSEIMIKAKDAINANDVLAFVNFSNIKTTAKGEVLGVEEEINRIKQEKPYLFGTVQTPPKKKAGADNTGGTGSDKLSMNAMIRAAAGRQY